MHIVGAQKLHQFAETKTEKDYRNKGFNLFSEGDTCLFPFGSNTPPLAAEE